MKVVELFKSIQGEGTRSGVPSVFLRLAGCNLNCIWCDTKYANNNTVEIEMPVDGVISEICSLNSNGVLCITGGEPLLCDEIYEFIEKLDLESVFNDIVIETNGSINISRITDLRKRINTKISLIMDYKLPGSSMTGYMYNDNFGLLDDRDEIKFVVCNVADFEYAIKVINKFYIKGIILFSPVYGKISYDSLASLVINTNLKNARMNIQMHKVIWGENTIGK